MPISRQAAIRDRLVRRATILRAIREWFFDRDYLEVATPVRIPAPAPEAHIDAQASGTWFLHPSPELCMKRLLAAGYPRIFQICPCFRRGERGGRHLPEMTLLEWYAAGHDYLDLMVQCEQLIGFVADRLDMGHTLNYRGHTVHLTPPWDRLTVDTAFRRLGGMSAADALATDRFDEIMGLHIEPRLGLHRPVLLYDYPAPRGALARIKPGDPPAAERFELYIAGMELCNGFSELTDPVEQRRRFEEENASRRAAGRTVYPTAESFLAALADMPPAAGNALGVDRLVMVLTDAATIDDVVAFTPEEL